MGISGAHRYRHSQRHAPPARSPLSYDGPRAQHNAATSDHNANVRRRPRARRPAGPAVATHETTTMPRPAQGARRTMCWPLPPLAHSNSCFSRKRFDGASVIASSVPCKRNSSYEPAWQAHKAHNAARTSRKTRPGLAHLTRNDTSALVKYVMGASDCLKTRRRVRVCSCQLNVQSPIVFVPVPRRPDRAVGFVAK